MKIFKRDGCAKLNLNKKVRKAFAVITFHEEGNEA